MRFSIESRVPFLLPKIAEFCLSLPEKFLISPAGETKHILRAAMEGIVPKKILARRDKIGFETHEQDLIFSKAKEIRKILGQTSEIPFLNSNKILNIYDDILRRQKPYNQVVWRWINFVIWHNKFMQLKNSKIKKSKKISKQN